MRPPLDGLPFLCTGDAVVLEHAGALLEALGAEVVRVPVLHGPEHARRVADVEPLGALDVTGLLAGLRPPFAVVEPAVVDPAAAWAASGALALTGRPHEAPLPVDPCIPARLLAAGAVVQLLAACRQVELALDPLALLGERAAIAGFGRQGATSVGGNCRLVRAADGWVALNLARPDDVAVLPALLDAEVAPDAPWPEVAAAIARRGVAPLEARAALLGLPLAAVPGGGDVARHAVDHGVLHDAARSPYRFDGSVAARPRLRPSAAPPVRPVSGVPLVVDLSSLWAGPLATAILRDAGARVVKVESVRRPDGARRGPRPFFDLLHHGKESVALDFGDQADVALLDRLVRAADVVVEGSRPRALLELGIDAASVTAAGGTTWISITGHGRHGDAASRVGFGDDAAAAGGLVVGDPPCFVADAVADPITGLYAAAVALAALVGGRGQVVDVALARCAAHVAAGADRRPGGPAASYAATSGATSPAAPPRARVAPAAAADLGAHTEQVRRELPAPRPTIRP
jgi:crotonobetainyl-CoA:carnitine CoA-transferase CaiB-like acyl-CoA transferase